VVATYNLSSFIGSGGNSVYSVAVGPDHSLYLLNGLKLVLYRIPLSKLPLPG
jgi:hypothetical protein